MDIPEKTAHGCGTAGADSLSGRVFHSLRSVMLLQQRLMMRTLAETGMHPAQAGCLRAIAHEEGISQSDLAERLHVSGPTVTRVLQKMEKAGVITRETDEADQRVTRVHLTAEGRRVVEELRSVFHSLFETGVGSMSEDDRRELERLLGVLGDNLQRALDEDGSAGAEEGAL